MVWYNKLIVCSVNLVTKNLFQLIDIHLSETHIFKYYMFEKKKQAFSQSYLY